MQLEEMFILDEQTKLGGFLKSIATGDIEKEVAELKKEARSINTPEEKSIILNRTVKVLHRAILIRHNWSTAKKFLHAAGGWIDKLFGKPEDKPEREIADKIKLIIADLSKIRDKVLATEVRGEADAKAVEERLKQQREKAEQGKLDQDDF